MYFTDQKSRGWVRQQSLGGKPLVGTLYTCTGVREFTVIKRQCSNRNCDCDIPYSPDDDKVHMQTRARGFTWMVSRARSPRGRAPVTRCPSVHSCQLLAEVTEAITAGVSFAKFAHQKEVTYLR